MSSGTEIIQSALQKLGAHSILKPASAESLANGLKKLNSMRAKWEEDGIKTGMLPLDVIGNELGEPESCRNGVECMLALSLQPDHPGTQVSSDLRIEARKEFAWIKRRYKHVIAPNPTVRDTYPVGQGRQRDSHDSSNNGSFNGAFNENGDRLG